VGTPLGLERGRSALWRGGRGQQAQEQGREERNCVGCLVDLGSKYMLIGSFLSEQYWKLFHSEDQFLHMMFHSEDQFLHMGVVWME
jgi:hypothetical protein